MSQSRPWRGVLWTIAARIRPTSRLRRSRSAASRLWLGEAGELVVARQVDRRREVAGLGPVDGRRDGPQRGGQVGDEDVRGEARDERCHDDGQEQETRGGRRRVRAAAGRARAGGRTAIAAAPPRRRGRSSAVSRTRSAARRAPDRVAGTTRRRSRPTPRSRRAPSRRRPWPAVRRGPPIRRWVRGVGSIRPPPAPAGSPRSEVGVRSCSPVRGAGSVGVAGGAFARRSAIRRSAIRCPPGRGRGRPARPGRLTFAADESITDAAHGQQVARPVRVGLELLAQAAHRDPRYEGLRRPPSPPSRGRGGSRSRASGRVRGTRRAGATRWG